MTPSAPEDPVAPDSRLLGLTLRKLERYSRLKTFIMRLLRNSWGIAAGKKRAQLAVFARLSKDNTVLGLKLTLSPQGAEAIQSCYAFLPAEGGNRACSFEFPQEARELLVGSKRATDGRGKFEVILSNGTTLSKELSFSEIVDRYRGFGKVRGFSFDEEAWLPNSSASEMTAKTLQKKNIEVKDAIEKARKEAEEKEKAEAEKRKQEAEAQKKALAAAAAAAQATKASGGAPAAEVGPAKIGLVYGSSTGNTAEIANQIKAAFGENSFVVKAITEIDRTVFEKFENVILGVPTWHIGEMQDDWAAFLPLLEAKSLKLQGKKLAIFGLGDGAGYPETYVDAMEELWKCFEPSGIKLVGYWPTSGYEFKKSKAIVDGKFLGLVIDIENQAQLSQGRVNGWVNQLKKEFA